jgi:hypothetical protein
MAWNLTIDHSLDDWGGDRVDLSGFSITDLNKDKQDEDSALNLWALSPEPRSLDSSELSDSSDDKKAPSWTIEKDAKLLETAQQHNFDWEAISKSFPQLSCKSLKKRWEKINKKKNKHDWTEEEDKVILKLYNQYGGNWKKISSYFNGLSPSLVKNRFYGAIKKKIEKSSKLNETVPDVNPKIKELNSKTLEELSAEEKRLKLQDLYNKVTRIQSYIETAKIQIQKMISNRDNSISR